MTGMTMADRGERRTPKPKGSHPRSVRAPRLVQGVEFAFFRRRAMHRWIRRYGHVFEMNVPLFGRSVVVSDPALVRSVCTAGVEELANVQPNLSNWFGPGSIFGLDGGRHRERRRLLAPALHGQNLKAAEKFIEDETLRECAKWPENEEFPILESMNRITLNVILRCIFGDQPELDELREIIPPYMKLGSHLAFVPAPPMRFGHQGPWGRLNELRESFNRIVLALVARAELDPGLGERVDVLAMLVRSSHEGGLGITQRDICDELMTLVGAGHETTASALGWAFERLRRHPAVLAELVRELDVGVSDFRRATILELLRVRTVVDVVGRRVESAQFDLGGWRIPRGRTVLLRVADLHENPEFFPEPKRFDPCRFRSAKPPTAAWLAFGGGARRCLGADFAIVEIDVVLRTVLRNFRIQTDSAVDEKPFFRGVAHTPRLGARVVLNRRTPAAVGSPS